jgi:hypothetical protein
MKLTRLTLIMVIILLSVILSSTSFANNKLLNGGLLWLNPASSTTAVGGTRDIMVQLENVANVFGAEIALSFDPTILAVVDADPGTPGVQIFTGSCPAPDFVLTNEADNSLGTIGYILTQLSPTPPCDGGKVATIRFVCLTEGIGQVAFTSYVVSDDDYNEIPVFPQGASLTCSPSFDHLLYLPLILK